MGAKEKGQEESAFISTEGEVELCVPVRPTHWDILPPNGKGIVTRDPKDDKYSLHSLPQLIGLNEIT